MKKHTIKFIVSSTFLAFVVCAGTSLLSCSKGSDSTETNLKKQQETEQASQGGDKEVANYKKMLSNQFSDGLEYLMGRYIEEEKGWPLGKKSANVAITGFAVKILADSPEKYREQYSDKFDGGLTFLLQAQQEDGAIVVPSSNGVRHNTNYKTAIAILAFVSAKKVLPKGERRGRIGKAVKRAKQFLVNHQFSPEFHNVKEEHWAYGGWDYDKKQKKPDADMSNTQFALQALQAANLPEDSPVWKRAAKFLQRSQNSTESNDLKEYFKEKGFDIGTDGGFMYYPAKSYGGVKETPEGKRIPRSYGSMTYAGVKSYIYANLDKDDPRVKRAYDWIRKNYTVERNPGMEKPNQALFYYYHTMAKALDVWGKPQLKEIKEDGSTVKHNWAQDLVEKLGELQRDDGSWKNTNGRWMEDNPIIATSYSLLILNICRDWIQS